MLADGQYDAFVVDVEDADTARAVALDLTITAGAHKGKVVTVVVSGLRGDPLALLGLPVTLVVRDGEPTVDLT